MRHFVFFLAAMPGFAAISCIHTVPPAPVWAVCTGIENYPLLCEAGYDYVEPTVGKLLMPGEDDGTFAVELEQVRTMKARIVSCTIFLPGQFRVVGPEINHDEILAWAETTFRRARQLEISCIVLGSGRSRRVPDDFSREQAKEQFVALCKRLGPLAERYGVAVVVEPLNTGETNFINTLAEGAEMVEATGHPNVRLLCDIYHMLRGNEPASEIVRYGKYIRHCHIAEREKRTAPGIAGDDFTPYFDALKEIGYAGCISVEASWEDDMAGRLASTLRYMRSQYGLE